MTLKQARILCGPCLKHILPHVDECVYLPQYWDSLNEINSQGLVISMIKRKEWLVNVCFHNYLWGRWENEGGQRRGHILGSLWMPSIQLPSPGSGDYGSSFHTALPTCRLSFCNPFPHTEANGNLIKCKCKHVNKNPSLFKYLWVTWYEWCELKHLCVRMQPLAPCLGLVTAHELLRLWPACLAPSAL